MKTQELKDQLIGRRVNKHVYTDEGHLLLSKGTVVNSSILSRLEDHAINTTALFDSLTKGIDNTGLVDDKQMEESICVVKKVFEYVLFEDANGVSSTIPNEYIKLVESVIDDLIDSLSTTGDLLYTVSDMVKASPYTYKHSINVTVLSILTAKALDYCDIDIRNIALGAFLHDIGKMIVDPLLIEKPSALTDQERIEVQRHPELGYNLLKNLDALSYTTKQIVLLHHEKLDGTGYPYGLKGIEIPEFVRIVTLCDMYDAMTTDRVYRNKMPIYTVLEILMRDSVYKLDSNVYRHMTENICIHPPGSGVVLSDGRIGIVSFYRTTNPSRPHIRVIDLNTDITNIRVENVNLEKTHTLFIVDSWDVNVLRKGSKTTFEPPNILPI